MLKFRMTFSVYTCNFLCELRKQWNIFSNIFMMNIYNIVRQKIRLPILEILFFIRIEFFFYLTQCVCKLLNGNIIGRTNFFNRLLSATAKIYIEFLKYFGGSIVISDYFSNSFIVNSILHNTFFFIS